MNFISGALVCGAVCFGSEFGAQVVQVAGVS